MTNKSRIRDRVKEIAREEKTNHYENWKDGLTREQLIWIAEPHLKLLFEDLWRERLPKLNPKQGTC